AQSGAVRVVDEAKLSYKGHRHYVQGALAAKPGQVYVSPIDLNREQGRVDPALQPTIRGSLAVRSAQGDVFGAVVVNHDAQNLLTELQAIAIDSGQLYVTDQRGQFLVH
ncbi:MAG: deoxyuridine 5'-triphosphate nucleotidohydrolase, partial [Quisquiliibacterium sp.]